MNENFMHLPDLRAPKLFFILRLSLAVDFESIYRRASFSNCPKILSYFNSIWVGIKSTIHCIFDDYTLTYSIKSKSIFVSLSISLFRCTQPVQSWLIFESIENISVLERFNDSKHQFCVLYFFNKVANSDQMEY